jgi:hypothetical protein
MVRYGSRKGSDAPLLPHDTRGRDAPVEELKVIDVARALPRFRALPDDTGIALEGDKRFARVRPILKLLEARGRYGW